VVDSRLAFDIMARDDGATAVLAKVERALDKTGNAAKKNSKISEAAAKASANLTKAHNAESDALDKVQVAEAKLADVRNNSKSKTGQIVAAEKALAKARRDAAVAGDAAQKAAKDLGKVLDNEGKKAGKGFLGSLKSVGKDVPRVVKGWFTGNGSSVFKQLGQNVGGSFMASFMGVLKTPVIGPVVAASLIAAVVAAATPAGAVIAGALVAGAGAGLAAIGIKFAAESAVVKSIWSKTASDLGAQMRTISKPFEATFAALSVVARRTFAGLKPELAAAFKTLAPAVTDFGNQLGRAFEKLGPALQPLASAFSKVLGALGPAMNDVFSKLSASLVKLSASISKNPTALADFARGIGGLTGDLVGFVTRLNDADAAFKRLTGGTSAVTALMGTLRGAVAMVTGPIDLLAQGFSKVADGTRWAIDRQFPGQAQDAAASTTSFSSSLFKAASGLTATTNAALHNAHATHEANVAAYLLATAYDRQWAATQKANQALMQMSGLLLTLSGSEIAYQQAVDDVTAAIKENGRTHDKNTQKGRDNQTALDQSAASANAQTINLRNSNKASVAVAIAAQREYAKQAVQMGYTATEAHRMAQEFIKIPKKTKADIQVDITDLTAKVATAKKHLKDPNLSSTKKAKLQADIVQWQAGIAAAKRSFAGLPVDKTAKLLANKADLDAKLAAAKKQLANPALTATKRAKLEAQYAQLKAAVDAAQAKINSLHGKTVSNFVITKYSSTGVNLQAPSSVGRRASGGPVTKGVPYIVGEHRPELFVPKQDGTILPKVPSMAMGQSVAAGLAGGIRGGSGLAISAAAEMANAVIAKANSVLGISSPSKKFTQIALYIAQGFNRGIRGSTASIQSSMAALMSKMVGLGMSRVKQNRVLRMLQMENKGLQAMANKRVVVAAQLKAAQDKLAGAIQIRDEFRKSITDAAMSFNSITNVTAPEGGQLTASGIIAQMTETLRRTQAFAANLAKLKAKGINATVYKQIAEAGVEQGGAIAEALLGGGPNTFNSINRLQANINSASAGLGNTAAANMYQAGVDAAQGLVNGLLAKTKALTLAAAKLANAIVAQIKRTLGIRSPSKVLEWHGSMAGLGFTRGIEGEYGRVSKAAAGLGSAATGTGGRPRATATTQRSGGGDVYITVNGAIDANATALQILQILKRFKKANGNVELGIA
jgi:hypothetical protein